MPIVIKGPLLAAEAGKPTLTEKPRQRARIKPASVSKPKRAVAGKSKRKPAKRTKAHKRA